MQVVIGWFFRQLPSVLGFDMFNMFRVLSFHVSNPGSTNYCCYEVNTAIIMKVKQDALAGTQTKKLLI